MLNWSRQALAASCVDQTTDSLFAASQTWESLTPYQATRHKKHVGAEEALSADLYTECRRRCLPIPYVTPLSIRGVPNVGLIARVRLTFSMAVNGPIVHGRSRHLGGRFFASVFW